MLELSGRQADGAHPYLVTPQHTAMARSILGEGKLLVPEQKIVLERDPDTARAIARTQLKFYLALPNYARSVIAQGIPAAELDEMSDRVVDRLIAWGSPEAIAERVQQHLDAGATSVLIQVLTAEYSMGMDELRELAPELVGR
jgi:probable F420-dependent oxidoreductase